MVYSMIPFRIPDPRHTAIAVFLTRANYGLAIGNFELDFDDRDVRHKTSVDVEGAALEQPLIDHLFLANVVTVDRYLRAMEAVVEGADPTAAVLGVDQQASD